MNDDLHSIAKEANDVVRIERLTHHIQHIREDQHAMRAALEAIDITAGWLYHGQGGVTNTRQRMYVPPQLNP